MRELAGRRIELAERDRLQPVGEQAAIEVRGVVAARDGDRLGLRVLQGESVGNEPRGVSRIVGRSQPERVDAGVALDGERLESLPAALAPSCASTPRGSADRAGEALVLKPIVSRPPLFGPEWT